MGVMDQCSVWLLAVGCCLVAFCDYNLELESALRFIVGGKVAAFTHTL